MADVPQGRRAGKKPSITADERNLRSVRARRRFRALVRLVIANRPWLEEVLEAELGENVKRNVQMLTKKKDKKSLLSIHDKSILNTPAEYRTESEKLQLYRIIGGLNCFRKYPEHVKMKMAGVTYFYYYGPGRVIVRQNQPGYALYFIVSGEVIVSITTFDPLFKEYVTTNVGTMVAGNLFGEVSLLHDIPRTATITTSTPCELLCLKKADFDIVLKATVQAEWDQIKRAMRKFRYFDGWDEVAVRECCIWAKRQVYAEDATILGDGAGMDKHVYFVLKGQCRVIEHLLLSTRYFNKKKIYKLYHAPPDETATADETATPIEAGTPVEQLSSVNIPRSVSEGVLDANADDGDSKQMFEIKGLLSANAMQTLSSTSQERGTAKGSKTAASTDAAFRSPNIPKKKKLGPKLLSSLNIPQVETHFMQVCTFSETACFNIGENLKNRRVVAITDVECMVIPKYWLMERNKGNLWTRIQQFLDSRIPTTEQVFQHFLENRRWIAYKKKLLHSIVPYPPSNLINNVPYTVRINDDIEFAESFCH